MCRQQESGPRPRAGAATSVYSVYHWTSLFAGGAGDIFWGLGWRSCASQAIWRGSLVYKFAYCGLSLCAVSAFRARVPAAASPASGCQLPVGAISIFLRAQCPMPRPYKQQAVGRWKPETSLSYVKLQLNRRVGRWTTARQPTSNLFFNPASATLAPVVALAPSSFANPAFSYLAVVFVRALRGIQSPEGEGTEISLL
jgi:hypothetical protein